MSADDVARAVERLALGIMHSLQAQALVVPPSLTSRASRSGAVMGKGSPRGKGRLSGLFIHTHPLSVMHRED